MWNWNSLIFMLNKLNSSYKNYYISLKFMKPK